MFKKKECGKAFIYTGAPVNTKHHSLTCNFSATCAWIFIQQTQADML